MDNLKSFLDNTCVDKDFGPLISAKAHSRATNLKQVAIKEGAEILYEKQITAPNELYFAPIALKVKTNMEIYSTEVFAPIFSIIPFETDEEVLKYANNQPYGLANYLYSESTKRISHFRTNLECGLLGINTATISMAQIPFGGVKLSGYGREGGAYGIDEYSYLKYTNQQF
eukprot:NODE_699_length_4634_cov_1.394487.p3 type:complete len:171 gc:universal NODE_699_length_4634_cov_1.394487:4571-4059(-)